MSPLSSSLTNESQVSELSLRETSPACSSYASRMTYQPAALRHRKSASAGGGRAWSEEEEAYLIETRAHKMPYKHIAAQLKKTELACRLHYHQLSFGGKRRRRAASVSSVASMDRAASVPPFDRTRESTPQRQLPGHFPPQSPDDSAKSCESTSRSPYNHVPILPKPMPATQRAADQTRSLRLITENIDGFRSKQHIDMDRLDKIYEAHRLHFWSMIARSYGCNLAPAVLEDAWRHAHCVSGGNFPPTPGTSPQTMSAGILGAPFTAGAEYTKHFTPISDSASGLARSAIERNHQSGLAISSLLTENKDIRSPPEGRKFSFSYESR